MATSSTQEWLSLSLRQKSESFSALHECHTFRAKIQAQSHGQRDVHDSSSTLPAPCPNVQRKKMQSEQEIHSYLDELDLVNFDIAVMAFARSPETDAGKFQLPISLELFDRVSQVLDISPAFLAVINTGVASFTVSLKRKNRTTVQGSEQLIIQQTRSHSHFSMGLTVSKTGKTQVLIFGAQAWSISELFDCLESAESFLEHPFVSIPTTVLELQARWFTRTINNLRYRIRGIEDTTGMKKPISQQGSQQPTQDWKDIDLMPITGELSSLLSRFSFLKMQAETGLYLIQRIQWHAESLVNKPDGKPGYMNSKDQHKLFSELGDTRGWYLGLVAQCNYLIQRTSAQTETVFALLASQNSIINNDIASASHNIAELSRKDNQAMRILAELSRRDSELMVEIARDSRSVALATARDSAAMRVIAAVTVLFLPATFTATFFSMSFFNFLETGNQKTSPWIWIYVVVTGLLTVVIQTTWALMSHRSQAKLPSNSEIHLKFMQSDDRNLESSRTIL